MEKTAVEASSRELARRRRLGDSLRKPVQDGGRVHSPKNQIKEEQWLKQTRIFARIR